MLAFVIVVITDTYLPGTWQESKLELTQFMYTQVEHPAILTHAGSSIMVDAAVHVEHYPPLQFGNYSLKFISWWCLPEEPGGGLEQLLQRDHG